MIEREEDKKLAQSERIQFLFFFIFDLKNVKQLGTGQLATWDFSNQCLHGNIVLLFRNIRHNPSMTLFVHKFTKPQYSSPPFQGGMGGSHPQETRSRISTSPSRYCSANQDGCFQSRSISQANGFDIHF